MKSIFVRSSARIIITAPRSIKKCVLCGIDHTLFELHQLTQMQYVCIEHYFFVIMENIHRSLKYSKSDQYGWCISYLAYWNLNDYESILNFMISREFNPEITNMILLFTYIIVPSNRRMISLYKELCHNIVEVGKKTTFTLIVRQHLHAFIFFIKKKVHNRCK